MCKKNQESTFLFGCHSDVWVQREHLRLPQHSLEFWILQVKSSKLGPMKACTRDKKIAKGEPSWCLLWSYWHANVALQSIPPLPWFCRDSSQHEAFESNFFCWILKFWAMAEINNWIATNKPHKNFSRLANVVHLAALQEPQPPPDTTVTLSRSVSFAPRGDEVHKVWHLILEKQDANSRARKGFFACNTSIKKQHMVYVYMSFTPYDCMMYYFCSMIPKRKVQTSKATKHTRWPRLETNHGIQHLGSFCAKNRNKTKLWGILRYIPGRCQPKKNKKRAMNLCLLRVPGTHLFSIWAFKALRKEQILLIRSKEKNHLGSRSPAVSIIPPSVFSRLFFKKIVDSNWASHDWIMFEISPKTHPKTQNLQRRCLRPRYQGRRNSRHTSSTPSGRRAAFEPALLRGIIAAYDSYDIQNHFYWNGVVCQKIIRLVVEYLKLPQVLGQKSLETGCEIRRHRVEMAWPLG